jgi:hypothetical protein
MPKQLSPYRTLAPELWTSQYLQHPFLISVVFLPASLPHGPGQCNPSAPLVRLYVLLSAYQHWWMQTLRVCVSRYWVCD